MAASATEMRLYEITGVLVDIEEMLIENDGVLTEEMEQLLDEMTAAFPEKVDGIASLVQQFGRMGEAAKAEAKRLADLAQARSNAAERLKAYLLREMKRVGKMKVETGRFVVRVQGNSRPSIAWAGTEETIPAEFRRVRVELDGAAAYEAHKAGRLPEGFEVNTGSHIRIQ